jgi:N-methylhydantoinase B
VLGGGDGACNVISYEQDDGWHHPALGSKAVGIRLGHGQRIRLETPGGGGRGPIADRSAADLERDATLGLVP